MTTIIKTRHAVMARDVMRDAATINGEETLRRGDGERNAATI